MRGNGCVAYAEEQLKKVILQSRASAISSNLTSRPIWCVWHNCVFSSGWFSKDLSAKEELLTIFSWKGHTGGEEIFDAFVGFLNKTKVLLFN